MRRIVIALVFALLSTAPLASAQKAIDITPSYIAGIEVGMTKAKAQSLMTKPLRHDRLEDGYERYVSPKQKVEVYFRTGTRGVAVVTTWNRTLQTDEQVGPCSPVAALKKAYGAKLVPFRAGNAAYRLGNLVFTVVGSKVAVVGLGRGVAATYVALNAPACR